MSGICGIVNLDGAPVARDEVERLAVFLDFRGPDARRVWTGAGAGLGHALLKTGDADVEQPLSLDGATWIAADARIDAQSDLRCKLKASGGEPAAEAGDATLILHAYAAWGEACVEHLLGDFAFAIWDAGRRRLFCARDHFGAKTFFHARVGNTVVFSNTLDCVRLHPRVTSRRDELAIADFLLFEINQDPHGTVFSGIRRLPPAHCLTAADGELRTRPYWSLPYEVGLHYRDEGEYVERFSELLGCAVADRTRTTDRVSLTLSGGLDSAGIAAVACKLPARSAAPLRLRGFTAVYDRLIPDEERAFSGMVAESLGIPIHYRAVDDYRLYEGFHTLAAHLPEPLHDPLAAVGFDMSRDVSTHARVALTGFDGDGLLSESPRAYFRHLLQTRHWSRLLRDGFAYVRTEKKLIPAGTWNRLNPWRRNSTLATEPFPAWLNDDLVARLRLRERFAEVKRERAVVRHPVRPRAFRVFEAIMRRSNFFDSYDASCTRTAVEYRHPLMDLRLLEHCLSLPPYPWCRGKEIFRRSMRGVLPEAVRTRPKTPLAGFPHHELLGHEYSRWIDKYPVSAETSAFVERAKIPSVCAETDPQQSWVNLRPLSLELWLRRPNTVPH